MSTWHFTIFCDPDRISLFSFTVLVHKHKTDQGTRPSCTQIIIKYEMLFLNHPEVWRGYMYFCDKINKFTSYYTVVNRRIWILSCSLKDVYFGIFNQMPFEVNFKRIGDNINFLTKETHELTQTNSNLLHRTNLIKTHLTEVFLMKIDQICYHGIKPFELLNFQTQTSGFSCDFINRTSDHWQQKSILLPVLG